MTRVKQESTRDRLQWLVENGRLAEAEALYMEKGKHVNSDYRLLLDYADMLINFGHFDDAEHLVGSELRKDPDDFDLLLKLGRIDEKKGQYLNAFDLYQRAEFIAKDTVQKRNAYGAKARAKNRIKGNTSFRAESYSFYLDGNNRPLELEYNLGQMAMRKQLLDAILDNIDHRAKNVMEVECDAGIIAKNLSDHGFKVEGTSANMENIVLAMGFEYAEIMRSSGLPSPSYYQLEMSESAARELDKKDVIMVLPKDSTWYTSRGVSASAALVKQLLEKAKKQLFFYVPPEATDSATLPTRVLSELKEVQGLNEEPEVCYESKHGGKMYLVNRRQGGGGDRGKVLPAGLDVCDSRSVIFEVDLEKCRSLNGFSYTEKGWDHFTALLGEILNNNDLTYEESILKSFYERFQPASRKEQLFGGAEGNLSPLEKGWTILPWLETKNRMLNPVKSPVSRPGGNHHYGPNDDGFGKREFKKLLITFALIRKYAYIPEIFPDGFVMGYLLKDGDDYRFCLTEGQHRMASLGTMNFKKFKVKFDPDYLPVVDIKNVNLWPQVKSGFYSQEVAEKVFRYYFEEDGRRKAEGLGLI